MKYLQNNLLFRFYSSRNDVEQILLLCTGFSTGLLTARILYTGSPLFVFLAWNLFLAFIPYIVSGRLIHSGTKKKGIFFLQFFIWLLFIPNSFYILTDLFHLDMNEVVPLWYDLALLISFAWTGLLIGIVSVRQMEKEIESIFNKKFDLLFLLPVMFLNGFGVYIGRYLRFNSWDIITNPFRLIENIVYLCIHPIRNRFDWSMIICYSILLALIYLAIKKLSKALS